MQFRKLIAIPTLGGLSIAAPVNDNPAADVECGVYTNHNNNVRLLYKDIGCQQLEGSASSYAIKDHCVCSFFRSDCASNDTLLEVHGPQKGDVKDPRDYICATVE